MHYEVISGYRCPETNGRLRAQGRAAAWPRRACTWKVVRSTCASPGVPLAELRDAALSLKAGRFHPDPQFVHIDTGRVRHW